MQGLWDFLRKWNLGLLFLLLEVLALSLYVSGGSRGGSVWFTGANAVAGHLLEWEAGVVHFASLGEVNRELTQRNLLLEHNLQVMRAELKALRHDSTYGERLQAKLLAQETLIPARVVTGSVRRADNLLTIDCGSEAGVRPEMGVVCGTGVVGIVSAVTPHYAQVMPLLHSKSRVSCRLRGTGYYGYLQWDGKNPLYALLTDVPRHARFEIGDVVETSGFSAVFPAGIFVGRVKAVMPSDDGMAYVLRVHLGIDFGNLNDVCVVASPHAAEIQVLERPETNR